MRKNLSSGGTRTFIVSVELPVKLCGKIAIQGSIPYFCEPSNCQRTRVFLILECKNKKKINYYEFQTNNVQIVNYQDR